MFEVGQIYHCNSFTKFYRGLSQCYKGTLIGTGCHETNIHDLSFIILETSKTEHASFNFKMLTETGKILYVHVERRDCDLFKCLTL